MCDRRRSGSRDRGFAVVFVAMGMVAMLSMTAVVVDIGYAKQMRREAQGAADAAALAAAQTIGLDPSAENRFTAAAEAAMRAAELNLGVLGDDQLWQDCEDGDALNRPDGYVVPPEVIQYTNTCVSFDDANNAVRVVLPTVQSPSFFGGIVGHDNYQVWALAEAQWGEPGPPLETPPTSTPPTTTPPDPHGEGQCGICGIGGAEFQYAHGSIDGGDREIHADILRINGNANSIQPSTARYWLHDWSNNNKVTREALLAPVKNPFESVTVDYTGVPMHPEMNASCQHLEPGKMYRQTVNINSNCEFPSSGIYYFKNGIQVSGTLKSKAGQRITLVFGCATGTEMHDTPRKCDGSHTGNVNISGGLQLGEPYYGGVSLLWDETAHGSSVINYNGNVKLGGAYYSKGTTPAFGNGTFRATAIVFGGTYRAATVNGGNIKIEAPSGGGGGDDDDGGDDDGGDEDGGDEGGGIPTGTAWLWR